MRTTNNQSGYIISIIVYGCFAIVCGFIYWLIVKRRTRQFIRKIQDDVAEFQSKLKENELDNIATKIENLTGQKPIIIGSKKVLKKHNSKK